MNLLLMLLFLNIFVTCDLNITDTQYKNYLSDRIYRCTKLASSKVDNFFKNTESFFSLTQSLSESNRNNNGSKCAKIIGFSDHKYVDEHFLDGLLFNENVPEWHWTEYKSVHRKKYLNFQQEKSALEEWQENLRRVAKHNRNFLAGKQSYSLHLNMFGDLGSTDYFKKVLKLIDTTPFFDPTEDRRRTAFRKNYYKRVPRQVDWTKSGYKPRLEEQWQCGACYAFAVTHAVQAQLFKRHRDWRELSPQQIVDCSRKYGNMGCDGGSLRASMMYVARDGLVMERNYPYKGKKGFCRPTYLWPRVRIQRWATLPVGNERAIEKALATIGPLAVAVNAAPFTFQLYRSGIYDDPFCTPWTLNHAMLLVGYTPQYWILLNWWGKDWGEDGYIRIRRGFNRCGVANMATYVEL